MEMIWATMEKHEYGQYQYHVIQNGMAIKDRDLEHIWKKDIQY